MPCPGCDGPSRCYLRCLHSRPFVPNTNRSLLIAVALGYVDSNPAHLEPIRQEASPQKGFVVPRGLVNMGADDHRHWPENLAGEARRSEPSAGAPHVPCGEQRPLATDPVEDVRLGIVHRKWAAAQRAH